MKLNKLQKAALEYYGLDFAQSGDPDCNNCWFAYTTHATPSDYPLTSCECIEDVAELYEREK